MKKYILFLPLSLFTLAAEAQTFSTTLAHNNASVIINNNGTFFHDPSSSVGGYEIPVGSVRKTINFMNFNLVSLDANGGGNCATATTQESDFYPGPIAQDYQNAAYLDRYSESIWEISRAEVENHIAHWNDAGYNIPDPIANWPGNGNSSNGEAAMLAPFQDVNNNQIYEPENGEYPLIRGDYAAYCIFNCARPNQVFLSGNMNSEIHLMFYQYNSANPVLNSTTFVHGRMVNRSPVGYFNFNISNRVNFDLGNPTDDYVGCDPQRNLVYCYNGDLNDETNGGIMGYGEQPPAMGILYLNHNLYTHNPITNEPTGFIELFQLGNGLQPNGMDILDPDGNTTRFVYDNIADGQWNEISLSNAPGERSTIMGIQLDNYSPAVTHCVDMAFVYANPTDSTLRSSVEQLFLASDFVQDFYNQQAYSCDPLLSVNEEHLPVLTLYPNPATNLLHIESVVPIEVAVLSADGKLVIAPEGPVDFIDISSLQSGYYFLKTADQRTYTFIKE